MANAPVKIWGKLSQYTLQILDFTLNMPHEILGPVAPHPKRSGVPPPGSTHIFAGVRNPIKALFSVLDHHNMLKHRQCTFKMVRHILQFQLMATNYVFRIILILMGISRFPDIT